MGPNESFYLGSIENPMSILSLFLVGSQSSQIKLLTSDLVQKLEYDFGYVLAAGFGSEGEAQAQRRAFGGCLGAKRR